MTTGEAAAALPTTRRAIDWNSRPEMRSVDAQRLLDASLLLLAVAESESLTRRSRESIRRTSFRARALARTLVENS
jgi:hypothetical protein